MKYNFKRLLFALAMATSIVAFWNNDYINYIKGLVVLIHEINHAIATLATGGTVHSISIHGNGNGETIATPSNLKWSFFFIVSAGYIGSSLIGGIFLYLGSQNGRNQRNLAILGLILCAITFLYAQSDNFTLKMGIGWGLFFIGLSLLGELASSYILIFIGTSISLYSIYDISDFTKNVYFTDAGLLASWILNFPASKNGLVSENVIRLGYLIAILWSIISMFSIYHFFRISFKTKVPGEESLQEMKVHVEEGNVQPDVADWFLNRGLDLNGKPLSPELLTELDKKVKN